MSESAIVTGKTTERSHRSLLFLPASVVADPTHALSDFYSRCASQRLPADFRADTFILDLEDSVAVSARRAACHNAAVFLEQMSSQTCRVFLRVTCAEELRDTEVELAAHPGIAGIVVPKIELANVDKVGSAFFDLGKPVWPIIETAKGFVEKAAIIRFIRERQAKSSIVGVIFGRDDLAASLRMDRERLTPNRFASLFLDFVCACRAEECEAIGPVFNTPEDPRELAHELSALRAMGFTGSLCVFPNQVREVNRAFTFVTPEVRAKYVGIREALAQASGRGLGWIIHDGIKYDIADLAYIDFVLSREA